MYLENFSLSGLITICGATATGKSGLAIALAQRLNSIILSADSRQVYREFDIGTAKPTPSQQQLVPHYLIDICAPTETLTVADYQQQAQALIASPPFLSTGAEEQREVRAEVSSVDAERLVARHRNFVRERSQPCTGVSKTISRAGSSPVERTGVSRGEAQASTFLLLLVGGTGLYIRSIVQGLKIPRVAPNLELRSQLQVLGQTHLYAMLQQVDSAAAQKIHPNESVRTLRALEVFYVTGKPISLQQGEHPPNYPILQIGLDCADAAALKSRIEQRTEQMLTSGWIGEVEFLCKKYGYDLPLLDTLGYREIKQYLGGDISLSKAKELTVLHTRQFAKRQRTWFRAYPQIEWFDATAPDLLERVWQRVQEFRENLS